MVSSENVSTSNSSCPLIMLHGLPSSVDHQKLKIHMEKFGSIAEFELMHVEQREGFLQTLCQIAYQRSEPAEQLAKAGRIVFEGYDIEVTLIEFCEISDSQLSDLSESSFDEDREEDGSFSSDEVQDQLFLTYQTQGLTIAQNLHSQEDERRKYQSSFQKMLGSIDKVSSSQEAWINGFIYPNYRLKLRNAESSLTGLFK